MTLTFQEITGSFTINRLPPASKIPELVLHCPFYSISRTEQELSIVCPSSLEIPSEKEEKGWSCFMVLGPLDFSLTGILADISGILAGAGISIFAISTFDTDYILVKSAQGIEAKETLIQAGHNFAIGSSKQIQ